MVKQALKSDATLQKERDAKIRPESKRPSKSTKSAKAVVPSAKQEELHLLKVRDQLIEQYMPYAASIASRVCQTLSSTVDYEEVLCNARLGLLEAAKRFDPKHDVDFRTFASMMDSEEADGYLEHSTQKLNLKKRQMNIFSISLSIAPKMGAKHVNPRHSLVKGERQITLPKPLAVLLPSTLFPLMPRKIWKLKIRMGPISKSEPSSCKFENICVKRLEVCLKRKNNSS